MVALTRRAIHPDEGVFGQFDGAYRCLVVETTVLAMPVIVVKPTRQVLLSLGRVCIGEGISPFAQRRLDEAFGFSVGARRIRPSKPVPYTQAAAHRGKLP